MLDATLRLTPFLYISEEYLAPVAENERDDMVKAYHKLLNSDDDEIR
jgi:hypothetical protein